MPIKSVKLVVLGLIAVLLMSCGKTPEFEESMFEVGVEGISDIRANVPFQLEGFLKNNSKYTWDIEHGAGLFTYQIFDEKNNLLPYSADLLFQNGIGFMGEFKPGEIYSDNYEEHRSIEYYEFIISEPGNYKVKVAANFLVNNGTTLTEQQIVSELIEFVVD